MDLLKRFIPFKKKSLEPFVSKNLVNQLEELPYPHKVEIIDGKKVIILGEFNDPRVLAALTPYNREDGRISCYDATLGQIKSGTATGSLYNPRHCLPILEVNGKVLAYDDAFVIPDEGADVIVFVGNSISEVSNMAQTFYTKRSMYQGEFKYIEGDIPEYGKS